jgi:hypothetical protein
MASDAKNTRPPVASPLAIVAGSLPLNTIEVSLIEQQRGRFVKWSQKATDVPCGRRSTPPFRARFKRFAMFLSSASSTYVGVG